MVTNVCNYTFTTLGLISSKPGLLLFLNERAIFSISAEVVGLKNREFKFGSFMYFW